MENTDELIRLVAKEAIKEFDKEQKEKKKKKALFKTNAEKTGGKFCISFVCVTGIKFKNCIYYSQKRR